MTNQDPSRSELEAELISKAMSDETFRSQLLKSPKAAVQDGLKLKTPIPDDIEIVVVEETPKKLYLVLPAQREAAVSPPMAASLLGCNRGPEYPCTNTGTGTWTRACVC